MKRIVRSILLIVAMPTIGCSQDKGRIRAPTDSVEVLAVFRSDSAFLVHGPQYNSLLWRRSGREWRADSLLSARPDVKLSFVDADSMPDLFFTIQWEEFVIGELWLARPERELQAFKSGDAACRIPELLDVNRDGRLDVIDWQAGALKPSECYGDALAATCQRAYPTEWPVTWIQGTSGPFVRDTLAASAFYAANARAYETASLRLRAAIRARTGPAASSSRCNVALATAIDALAQRASAIATAR